MQELNFNPNHAEVSCFDNRFRYKMFECKIVSIFLPISFNICFGCSKELSRRDGSFEYPQNMLSTHNIFFG